MDNTSSSQPSPATAPARVPLARLAGPGAASPALLRVVGNADVERGPGRVAVAAFNSSV